MTTRIHEKKVCTLAPAVDVIDRKDAVVITADLPGIEPDKLEIDVKDSTLILHGERTPMDHGEDYKLLHQDVYPVAYHRSFKLSGDVDQSAIRATLNNGVLTLELPKAEKAQLRKIPVQV